MGMCFSDAVEKALQYIYYDLCGGKGEEGFALLSRLQRPGMEMYPVPWPDVTAEISMFGADMIFRRTTTGPPC